MSDVQIRRQESDLLCGRLVALPSTTSLAFLETVLSQTRGYQNVISVDFPAMPDTIELARSADYAVNYNIVAPDGIHQYKGTKPMEIPISFKLHSLDQSYCKRGALTLLELAARLHSFVLPINKMGPGVVVVPYVAGLTKDDTGRDPDPVLEKAAANETVYTLTGVNNSQSGGIYSPVTCWLHLMWTDNQQPGISAVGYVRDAKVVFQGPWLRGPRGSFNLPTSAEFSFTFVHRPGHNNSQKTNSSLFPPTIAKSGQTYADDVRQRLYNTRDLVHASTYEGFATNPTGLSEPQ